MSAAIIDLVAATERSRPAQSGSTAFASRASGEASSLTKATDKRALILRRALHGEDVGASPRLRDGDRNRALELERRMIERGDRGPDGGASQPELKLDQVLEIKRRMVGTAARDRCDERRLQRP